MHLYTCLGSAIGRAEARADLIYSLIQGYAYVLKAKPFSGSNLERAFFRPRTPDKKYEEKKD